MTLPDDVARLAEAIDVMRECGRTVAAVVIDPLGAFLSEKTDSHKAASVRRALAPLAKLAMDKNLVVVVVAHLNKDESQRLLARVNGSGAFGQAPRSVLAFARDPGDPDGEQGADRVIVHAKSNWGRYATSLAVRVESCDVETGDGPADVGLLSGFEESTVSVEDLQRGRDDHDSGDVEETICAALSDGKRASRDVKAQVTGELGCSRRTVERAAMRMHGRGELAMEKGGFPPTSTWTLANGDTPIATHLPSPRVANGRSPMNTGVSGNGKPVSDTAQGHVAIERWTCEREDCGALLEVDEDARETRCGNGHRQGVRS